MSDHYVLEGHEAVPCDAMTWARWFEDAGKERIVALTEITPEVRVSTVFLGLDHSFGGPVPLVFETMIFGGEHDEDQWRYTTWAEAVAGHERAMKVARGEADE
jgi:hypothetical protein